MKVLIATSGIENLTFSFAYHLAAAGCEVKLWALPGFDRHSSSQYYLDKIMPYLCQFDKNENILDEGYDRILVESGWQPFDQHLQRKIADAATPITLSAPSFNSNPLRRLKMSAGYIWRFRHLLKTRPRMIFVEFQRRFNLLSRCASSISKFGVDLHHKFWIEPELKNLIFGNEWESDQVRRHKVNFVGRDAPSVRTNILNSIREMLRNGGHSVASSLESDCPWYCVGPSQDGLDAKEYCSVMLHSEFALCPPGFAVWSHRVIEACMLGSIPVLPPEAAEVADIGLKDGIHCVIVENADWTKATKRMLDFSQDEIVLIRKNLKNLISSRLTQTRITDRIVSTINHTAIE